MSYVPTFKIRLFFVRFTELNKGSGFSATWKKNASLTSWFTIIECLKCHRGMLFCAFDCTYMFVLYFFVLNLYHLIGNIFDFRPIEMRRQNNTPKTPKHKKIFWNAEREQEKKLTITRTCSPSNRIFQSWNEPCKIKL